MTEAARNKILKSALSKTILGLFLGTWLLVLFPATGLAQDARYKQYIDPEGRFSFEYPATMKVQSANNDEVKVYHPGAGFRISVFVEKHPGKSKLTAPNLLAASKKQLEEQASDVSVIGQGKLPGIEGSQGYIVVSFRDARGTRLVQTVQYYVVDDRFLQMTIADRAEGYKNLEPVVQRVHNSLKILKPQLK
jgi:hypothetical protein